ncbi:unnamed protein product [Leptidea sinapis]|uniref:Small EDRK-rich factor-like N-terminal domain-containing protein n=1 Tax=Leptidea sinapis TaxID=189913 RepID=A0A5E4PNY0_9NEOP|nr:unnamed protein product [Leptidea sinapis]
MTRGNQRDLARAKNAKKQQEQQKKKNASEKTGMSLSERKHRDAELMREKQRRKEEQSLVRSKLLTNFTCLKVL